jgi:hypothetical protein
MGFTTQSVVPRPAASISPGRDIQACILMSPPVESHPHYFEKLLKPALDKGPSNSGIFAGHMSSLDLRVFFVPYIGIWKSFSALVAQRSSESSFPPVPSEQGAFYRSNIHPPC